MRIGWHCSWNCHSSSNTLTNEDEVHDILESGVLTSGSLYWFSSILLLLLRESHARFGFWCLTAPCVAVLPVSLCILQSPLLDWRWNYDCIIYTSKHDASEGRRTNSLIRCGRRSVKTKRDMNDSDLWSQTCSLIVSRDNYVLPLRQLK